MDSEKNSSEFDKTGQSSLCGRMIYAICIGLVLRFKYYGKCSMIFEKVDGLEKRQKPV